MICAFYVICSIAMQNLIDLHQNWILLASANALHCIFLLVLDLFEYELHSHIIQAMMSRISNIFSERFPFKKKKIFLNTISALEVNITTVSLTPMILNGDQTEALHKNFR